MEETDGPGLPRRDYEPTAMGTLAGVRVLDLSRLFAGNLLTQILGDFGADVDKIEPPTGDTLRAWTSAGIATHWKVYGRNKRSLCLDLRRPEASDIIRRLVAGAAILVESFRPGVLEAMGLAPAALHAINPALVIVRISGWGQDGPYAKRPGFGTLIESFTGFAAMNGFADREPVLPPMYLADGVAGLYGASATMIALREAERGGRGQVVDLSLLEPLFAVLGTQAANYRLTGRVKPRTGSRSTNASPRNVYRCSDGLYVGLSASIQKMAERLFRAIGREDMIADPRFRTNADRLRHQDELDAAIAPFIAARTQADNVTFFEAAEVTIGPVNDVAAILRDPHVAARVMLADYPDPDMGWLPMHGVVPRMAATPGSIRRPAPGLGEHNGAVLKDAGFSAEEIAGLRACGVVREGG